MILHGRRVLVAGVTDEKSLGYAVARRAQQEGATVVVSSFGRALGVTRRVVKRLPEETPVLELDVRDEAQLATLAERLGAHVDGLDGVVHCIAHADPETVLGTGILGAAWPEVAEALQVSTYSLTALTRACLPLMSGGGSVVGLTFDASVTWPGYGWMGVAKAGLEASARYLARELGPSDIRVNLVAAGPVRTLAASALPPEATIGEAWSTRAPLGWDDIDASTVAGPVVALLSDLTAGTTGEIVHADGGFHSTGL